MTTERARRRHSALSQIVSDLRWSLGECEKMGIAAQEKGDWALAAGVYAGQLVNIERTTDRLAALIHRQPSTRFKDGCARFIAARVPSHKEQAQ